MRSETLAALYNSNCVLALLTYGIFWLMKICCTFCIPVQARRGRSGIVNNHSFCIVSVPVLWVYHLSWIMPVDPPIMYRVPLSSHIKFMWAVSVLRNTIIYTTWLIKATSGSLFTFLWLVVDLWLLLSNNRTLVCSASVFISSLTDQSCLRHTVTCYTFFCFGHASFL